MKTALSALLAISFLTLALLLKSEGQEPAPPRRYEYITIRWAAKENTHLIRPNGQVEFIGSELRKLVRPDRCDERSFYMNAAVNGLGKEGWDLAGMTPDEIVMRRSATR